MRVTRIVSSLLAANLMAFGAVGIANATAIELAQNQKATEQVVHDYILKNPDVVIQSLQGYQQKQMDQARKTMEKTQTNAPKYADPLFHQSIDPMTGNPTGKVTVVEFFDYQCPHCIDMTPVMTAIVKANPEVRVVYKEFPIRGPASETAAKAALAAQMQGKYIEFQHALMGVNKLPLTDDIIFDAAKSVGLDMEKLKTDMKSKTVEQQIKDTYKLAQDLQLMGTPALFIAKSNVNKDSTGPNAVIFIPGQVNVDQLQDAVSKVGK